MAESNAPAQVMSRSSGVGTLLYTWSVGKSDFGDWTAWVTTNARSLPSAIVTTTASPAFSSPILAKTAGAVGESTWPAMIAGPTAPGGTPSAYQPARS